LLAQHGGHKIGYKIGCTSEGAQKLLNTDGPVYGQMLSAWQHQSPSILKAADFTMLVIEPEFAFTVSQDVLVGNYDADSIRPFIANVIPSIEIVHHLNPRRKFGPILGSLAV
jgi:2-keto-4-pentenoate hydratase